MSTRPEPPWAIGTVLALSGYFTKRHVLGDLADGVELERRIGYAPGTLSAGWYVLFMIGMPPTANEFELGGYSHFSNSRIRGHTDEPGEHVEQWLRSHAIDLRKHRESAAARFTLNGAERLVKIRPVLRCQTYWHPDPNPVPQWRLGEGIQKQFVVAAFHA